MYTAAAPALRHPLNTSRLCPTSLKELNSAASLLTRVDRKYLVPSSAAQDVVDTLTERALVLDIDGHRSFAYASTYFDTPGLDSYLQAARKRRHRFKVRTRSYLDSGLTFLEVKTRGPRGATVKQRLDYRPQDADRLTQDGLAFVVTCLVPLTGSRQEAQRIAQSLRPVLTTTYRRTTLHLPGDDARATIDTDLTWAPLTVCTSAPSRTFPARGGRRSRPPAVRHGTPRTAGPFAVVETKNPARCSPADRYLWACGHRPTRLSKYATGMAALHPELPANKWHRLLTHELTTNRRHSC